jgi:hypothetical protein
LVISPWSLVRGPWVLVTAKRDPTHKRAMTRTED